MIRVALRGLWGRKLRAILTAFAIILGVATVSGTYVLTDSIGDAFDNIFTGVYRGTDAVISGKSAFDLGSDSNVQVPAFDQSLLPKVRALPEVGAAIGGVAGEAQLIGSNGKVIQFGGAPNLGFSVDPSQPQFNSLTLVDGKWPGPGQFVVDTSTAGKKDIKIGDTIRVQAQGRAIPLRVSGLVNFGAVDSIGGATLAGFGIGTAQKLFHKEGKLDQIRTSRRPGRLRAAAARVHPRHPPARHPGTHRREPGDEGRKRHEELHQLPAELPARLRRHRPVRRSVRDRELALDHHRTADARVRHAAHPWCIPAPGPAERAGGVDCRRRPRLGRRALPRAGARQGAVRTLLGGRVHAAEQRAAPEAADDRGRTARRDRRHSPGQLAPGAPRDACPPDRRRPGGFRPAARTLRQVPRDVGSALLAVVGFAALAYGLFGPNLSTSQILLFMGFGTLCIFFGVALFSAQLVTPLATVIGAPGARWGGAPGVLARENAQRNPQRTGSTAAALMIGLALVTLVAMLAAGIRASFFNAVDHLWATDYAVTAENNYSPIPISVEKPIQRVPGVQQVVGVRTGEAKYLGKKHGFTGVGPGASSVFRLDWTEGSQAVMDNLGADGAFIDKDFAKDHSLHIGSPIPVLTPQGEQPTFTVKGIFDPPTGGSPFAPVTVSAERFDELFAQPDDLFVFITMQGGVTPQNTAALDKTLANYPNAKVQDQQEFKDNQASGLNATLNILYVLLALSVLVSLFGIVNTLVLTVFERTRELGMLRAVGMTRSQVRWLIRYESIITALIGAAIGIALGIVLAVLLIARVDFIILSWPVVSLIVFVLAAIAVGLIAAIFPARRASRLNVLEALQYE